MDAFLKPFEGFCPQDFETYTSEKWSSNLYNLQRLRVKQKLVALASVVQPDVEAMRLALEAETSAERPSIWNRKRVDAQWLYFSRDAYAKKELSAILDRERSLAENIDDPAHYHRHAVLAVRVDEAGVAVLLGVHQCAWLDRRNMQQKWANAYQRPRLLALFADAPADMLWCGDGETAAADQLTDARLDGLLSRAVEVEGWIALERRYDCRQDRLTSPDFAVEVRDALETLAPFYRYFAWSRENDFVAMAPVVAQEKRQKRRSGNAQFCESDVVEIVGGLFAGQRGVVTGYDQAGKIKVKVGNLTLPVKAGALKRLTS